MSSKRGGSDQGGGAPPSKGDSSTTGANKYTVKIPQERREKGEQNDCKTKGNCRETWENELRKGGKERRGEEKQESDNSTTTKRRRMLNNSFKRGDRDATSGCETMAIGAETSEKDFERDERGKRKEEIQENQETPERRQNAVRHGG